ncbi:hypothetical protein [Leptotrichia sp. oral taxon 221]|uniref:hypothetical protein n=1 Tax=Leptotrichia sp. oral taxon 221 TaxID=712362 RepID=UPI001B8ACA64|nr:hypothetical protein [Leptotrichia sp. oral taxon 221]QUB97941.1 hypothetical protein J4863_04355 [Leptotrichia sp. oral taxon 221]
MKIEKIRTDSYSILKISKYDFLVKLIKEIGNFPYVVSNIYEDNSTKTTIVEDQGMYINNGWNETDETALYISECNSDSEIRVYYGYEELFSYFLIYYFENIVDYANLISFVEQELHNYIEYMEKFKNFRINVDLENLFKRDKSRKFLLKYNEKENKYNLEFINYYTKYINYWDIDIKKKFFSYLLGKDRLKEFMLNKKRVFRINGVDYFQIEEKEKYSEIYRIEIENDIKIEYYSKDLEYESFGNVGFLYKEKNFDIENKNLKCKELNFERYRDNRDEMNVERISKEDFLKELEIIVNAYKDIYNDIEIEEMFENFKENF